MKIKVLGPGCPTCVTLERLTRQVLDATGVEATKLRALLESVIV